MNFKKWVKSIQTADYNGTRTVYDKEVTKLKVSFSWNICAKKAIEVLRF